MPHHPLLQYGIALGDLFSVVFLEAVANHSAVIALTGLSTTLLGREVQAEADGEGSASEARAVLARHQAHVEAMAGVAAAAESVRGVFEHLTAGTAKVLCPELEEALLRIDACPTVCVCVSFHLVGFHSDWGGKRCWWVSFSLVRLWILLTLPALLVCNAPQAIEKQAEIAAFRFHYSGCDLCKQFYILANEANAPPHTCLGDVSEARAYGYAIASDNIQRPLVVSVRLPACLCSSIAPMCRLRAPQ